MQPLDLTFFGPLKATYKKECDLFLKNRLAEKITPYDVAAIFNRAYSTVASINKGESGFRAAGIVPYNPDHFTEEDFTAAEVLAQPAVIVQDSSMVIPASTSVNPMTATSSDAIIPAPSTSSATIDPVPSTPPATINLVPSTSSATIDPVPLTSSATIDTRLLTSPTVMNATPSTSSGNIQSNIANLLPFPTQTTRERLVRKGQMKQHAKILTSTPVKDSLIEKENKKATKAAKTVKTSKPSKDKNAAPKAKGKQKKQVANKAKRRVLQESNSSSESDISLNKICDDDEDDDLNKCLVCDEFGRNNELWYRCTSCGLWAHQDCTGWESPRGYVCDNC